MAIQSSFYTGTALDGRTFPSSKHIATKAHMAIWKQRVSDNVWVQTDIDEYQLINNSCVLNTVVEVATYDQIEIRVADAPDELADNPTDISTVAGLSAEIIRLNTSIDNVDTVANELDATNVLETISADLELGASSEIRLANDNKDNIDIVAGDTVAINAVKADLANVDIVANNIVDVNTNANSIDSIITVANALDAGLGGGTSTGGQYHGNSIIKGVEYFSQFSSSSDDIIITSGTNAISVDSFTIANGASLTIQNNSVYKVL